MPLTAPVWCGRGIFENRIFRQQGRYCGGIMPIESVAEAVDDRACWTPARPNSVARCLVGFGCARIQVRENISLKCPVRPSFRIDRPPRLSMIISFLEGVARQFSVNIWFRQTGWQKNDVAEAFDRCSLGRADQGIET